MTQGTAFTVSGNRHGNTGRMLSNHNPTNLFCSSLKTQCHHLSHALTLSATPADIFSNHLADVCGCVRHSALHCNGWSCSYLYPADADTPLACQMACPTRRPSTPMCHSRHLSNSQSPSWVLFSCLNLVSALATGHCRPVLYARGMRSWVVPRSERSGTGRIGFLVRATSLSVH